MLSITMHPVYIAVLTAATLALAYQGLITAYTMPLQALTYCLCAIGTGTIAALLIRRWFHLEYLWSRAMNILVPNQATAEVYELVRSSLNNVLGKKNFRHEMKRALNRNSVFKLFMENSIPVIQLDITFNDSWNNHNYLRSAVGWISTCMPTTMTCQTLERRDTRLVFRFVHQDVKRKDAQGLHNAISEWKTNMQRVLVLHLNDCTVQDLNYVPQKIKPQLLASSVPRISKAAFEEDVLLSKENVRLHIGFNGSAYYTYFEDGVTTQVHGRREYQSWPALWSVWRHIKEVQAAFQTPVYSSDGQLSVPSSPV